MSEGQANVIFLTHSSCQHVSWWLNFPLFSCNSAGCLTLLTATTPKGLRLKLINFTCCANTFGDFICNCPRASQRWNNCDSQFRFVCGLKLLSSVTYIKHIINPPSNLLFCLAPLSYTHQHKTSQTMSTDLFELIFTEWESTMKIIFTGCFLLVAIAQPPQWETECTSTPSYSFYWQEVKMVTPHYSNKFKRT